ncbi:hypothetical protein [Pseudogracilibacillus sp. SO30301A]|uniref:hypothetical protein n=1 Tax=Pseudogracilibacillus sp. SO30301A TaxID=3098291 RepID=UPI00300DECF5
MHELTDIPNFSHYKADLHRGRIYSLISNKWLNPKANKRFGYVYSTLKNNNGTAIPISIHTVIMSAHLNKSPESWKPLTVNHIDLNKENNSIHNLELIEHKDQFCDIVRSRMGQGERLSNDDVRYLRLIKEILKVKGEYAQNTFFNYFSERLYRSYTTIQNIVNNVTYQDIQLTDKEKELINRIRLQHDLVEFGISELIA